MGEILHVTVIQNVTFNETLFYKKGFVNDSSANCGRASLYDLVAAHACLRVQDVYNSHIWWKFLNAIYTIFNFQSFLSWQVLVWIASLSR